MIFLKHVVGCIGESPEEAIADIVVGIWPNKSAPLPTPIRESSHICLIWNNDNKHVLTTMYEQMDGGVPVWLVSVRFTINGRVIDTTPLLGEPPVMLAGQTSGDTPDEDGRWLRVASFGDAMLVFENAVKEAISMKVPVLPESVPPAPPARPPLKMSEMKWADVTGELGVERHKGWYHPFFVVAPEEKYYINSKGDCFRSDVYKFQYGFGEYRSALVKVGDFMDALRAAA